MLDPDAIVWHDLVFADLQDLASERFDRQETELRAGLEGRGYGEAAVDRAVEGALTQPIAPGQFDAAAGAPFLKRQAYLHHDGRVEHARTRVGSGIGYPFVDALQIARPHRPDGISERHTTLSLPGQLALAAERGQITPWDRTRVAQAHVTQSDRAAVDDGWELARLLFGGASPQVAPTPFALSEAGLRWYSRPSEYDPRIAIVVGDDPWDFSWFYALRRMRGNAFWVPDCYASDLAWVTELRMLPLRLQLGASAVFSVTSVSGSEHVATVAAALEAPSVGEGSVEVVLWDSLTPFEPRHLLVENSFSAPTTLSIDGDTSAHFPSPVPHVRCDGDPFHMQWMCDVNIDGWAAINSDSLGSSLLAMPHASTSRVRPSYEGISYLCPRAFITGGVALEQQTDSPRVKALDLQDQLRTVLAPQDWDIRLSDKGIYANQSAELFGGLLPLADAISQSRWRNLLMALARSRGTGLGHYQRADQRRYFTLEEIKAAIATAGMDHSPAELVRMDIIWRGLRHRCHRCRWEGWHGQDEIGSALRCPRCRLEFDVHSRHWVGADEPQWWYRLNEVLWQFVTTHSDLALKASVFFLHTDRPATLLAPAMELVGPDGSSSSEVDLIVLRGRRLWIGEAKIGSSLGGQTAAGTQLNKLRSAARLLKADGILMVSGSPSGFSDPTVALIKERLGELDLTLRIETLT
jgi:hypothetical protein